MAKAIREAITKHVASSSTGEETKDRQQSKRPQKFTLLPAGRRPAANHPNPTVPFPLEPLLDIPTTARILGISRQCLRLKVKAREIHYVREGKLIKFRQDKLREHIERNSVPATPKRPGPNSSASVEEEKDETLEA